MNTRQNIQQTVKEKISELDNGEGVEVEILDRIFTPTSALTIAIDKLRENGDIMEVKPNIYKVVE